MKLLFLCTTEFQLLTAMNIKCHMYPDDKADIVVDNYHGAEESLAGRINELGWFRNVCYVSSEVENKTLHAFFRGITDGEDTLSFKRAAFNTGKFLRSRIGEKIAGEKIYLDVLLKGISKLEFADYDAFFAYGDKPISKRLAKYIRSINNNCKMIQMDEGVGAYYDLNIGGESKVDSCILYEPKANIFPQKCEKIPAISSEDREFIQKINYVFDFNEKMVADYSNSVIYFDQGVYDDMPKYLQGAMPLKKIIFHNAYKRHKREEENFFTHKRLTKDILDIFTEKDIWIKPHPRSSQDTLNTYPTLGTNIRIIPQYQVPWEVIALNSKINNTLLLTKDSSSVFLFPSIIPQKAIKTVGCVLYKLWNGNILDRYGKYIYNIKKMYPKQIFIPNSKDEFVEFVGSINML